MEDRSKLQAYLLDEAGRCQMCGTYEWEWEENRTAYTPASHLCYGCQALDVAREEYEPGPGFRMVLLPSARVRKMG